MRAILLILIVVLASTANAQEKSNKETNKVIKDKSEYNKLNEFETYVIINKGTEHPFTGEYNKNKKKGTYICRQCNAPLYHPSDKFESNCGWPSFDDEIEGAE